MKKIKVDLGNNSYFIISGSNVLRKLNSEIIKLNLPANLFIIVDENVKKLHAEKILEAFDSSYSKVNYYILKQGEKSKSSAELNKIYSELVKKNYGRDSLIIAIGGGVTGDLAGYAASTYMRGVDLIHVPTTLLADVDSSIGGKTGINLGNKKNMIGTFYQPKLVLIDTDFIKTLPADEFNSGIGEVVKYAFLSNRKFYDFIFKNFNRLKPGDNKFLDKIISESVQFKASVVNKDEKESGLRKILNLGHTFGHAYESAANFKIKHGEAVIAGIISSLYLSYISGLLGKDDLNSFLNDISNVKISKRIKMLNPQNILDLMKHDKKNREGLIKFVLIGGIGKIYTDFEAENKMVLEAIKLTRKII